MCGETVKCLCGKSVQVPRLRDLRTANGISNSTALERLESKGNEGPLGTGCVLCDLPDGAVVELELIAERPEVIHKNGWVAYLGILFGLTWATLLQAKHHADQTATGDERKARFWVRICDECASKKIKSSTLEKALRSIPEVEDIFREYPGSEIHVLSHS